MVEKKSKGSKRRYVKMGVLHKASPIEQAPSIVLGTSNDQSNEEYPKRETHGGEAQQRHHLWARAVLPENSVPCSKKEWVMIMFLSHRSQMLVFKQCSKVWRKHRDGRGCDSIRRLWPTYIQEIADKTQLTRQSHSSCNIKEARRLSVFLSPAWGNSW